MFDVFCLDAVILRRCSLMPHHESMKSILTHLCYILETASPVVRYLAFLSPAKRNHRELDAIESYSLVSCGAFIACTELDYDLVLIQVQLWIALV